MKTSLISVAQAFLMQLPGVGIDANRIDDGDLYIRKEITGAGGTIDLITASTTKTNGVTTFDKNRIPATIRMVLERISFGYATTQSNNTDGEAGQRYANLVSGVPAILVNADLIIVHAEKTIVEVPVERLLTKGSVLGTVGAGADSYWLDSLRELKPNAEINIRLRFPEGKSLGSDAKHFVELHLIGPMAKERQ